MHLDLSMTIFTSPRSNCKTNLQGSTSPINKVRVCTQPWKWEGRGKGEGWEGGEGGGGSRVSAQTWIEWPASPKDLSSDQLKQFVQCSDLISLWILDTSLPYFCEK